MSLTQLSLINQKQTIFIILLIAITGFEKYLPPSEKLSGVIFKIPITAGVLKPKYGFLKDLEKFTMLF